MSTGLQQQAARPTNLRAWIAKDEVHSQLEAAVGDVMDTDQFIAHMMVAFQDEKVRRCTDQSKYTALHECAALTLLPTLGQVVLIPYKNEIKAMPQWQGYKALMERHPDVLEVTGHIVHVGDDFAVLNGEVRHSYDPFSEDRTIDKPADIKGGYCKIVYRDGRPPKYHFVTVRQISKAQKCAQTQKVWSAWYEQMATKTLYRDCYARRAVPMDPLVQSRMEKALKIEDVNMGNDPSRVLPEASPDDMMQRLEAATTDSSTPSPDEVADAENEAAAEVAAEAATDEPTETGLYQHERHNEEIAANQAALVEQYTGEFAKADASRVAQLSTMIDSAMEQGEITRVQWLELSKEAEKAKTRLSETE